MGHMPRSPHGPQPLSNTVPTPRRASRNTLATFLCDKTGVNVLGLADPQSDAHSRPTRSVTLSIGYWDKDTFVPLGAKVNGLGVRELDHSKTSLSPEEQVQLRRFGSRLRIGGWRKGRKIRSRRLLIDMNDKFMCVTLIVPSPSSELIYRSSSSRRGIRSPAISNDSTCWNRPVSTVS